MHQILYIKTHSGVASRCGTAVWGSEEVPGISGGALHSRGNDCWTVSTSTCCVVRVSSLWLVVIEGEGWAEPRPVSRSALREGEGWGIEDWSRSNFLVSATGLFWLELACTHTEKLLAPTCNSLYTWSASSSLNRGSIHLHLTFQLVYYLLYKLTLCLCNFSISPSAIIFLNCSIRFSCMTIRFTL